MALDFSKFKAIKAEAEEKAFKRQEEQKEEQKQRNQLAKKFWKEIVDSFIAELDEETIQDTFNEIFRNMYILSAPGKGELKGETYSIELQIYYKLIDVDYGSEIYDPQFLFKIDANYNNGFEDPQNICDREFDIEGDYAKIYFTLRQMCNYVIDEGMVRIEQHLKDLGLKIIASDAEVDNGECEGNLLFEIDTQPFFVEN